MFRVVLADDELILRESLKFMLERDKEIEVTGLAGNGAEAFEKCREQKPDLVLMDICMPGCDGVEGTRLIKECMKDVKVIILTTFNDAENVKKALLNGADGYLLKELTPSELISAIKSAVSGFGVVSPDILGTMAKNLDSVKKPLKTSEIKSDLTDNELQIIKILIDGKSNREIASMLFMSEGSIKNAISSILAKLELNDRTQLAVYAVRNGLV